MKYFPASVSLIVALGVSGCVGLPNINNMFYPVESDKPDYARGSKDNPRVEGRAPLDVPPELRNEVSVPMPDKVAAEAAKAGMRTGKINKAMVAGKAVALDVREYDRTPAQVFSAVIDAMTALNMPVDSVDSPSGTVTTTWVRHDSSNANAYVGSVMNVFGAGPTHTRYRFIVRVLRTRQAKTRLEIRTLGQEFTNRHWVNKPIKRKVSNELFTAVEERLPAAGSAVSSPDAGARLPAAKP